MVYCLSLTDGGILATLNLEASDHSVVDTVAPQLTLGTIDLGYGRRQRPADSGSRERQTAFVWALYLDGSFAVQDGSQQDLYVSSATNANTLVSAAY